MHSAEPVSQMLNDWKQIDFEGITRQAMWTFSESVDDDYELVYECKCAKLVLIVFLSFKSDAASLVFLTRFYWFTQFADYKEFTQLLDQQATIDQYAEWASSLVNRCVLKVSTVGAPLSGPLSLMHKK